MSGKQLLLRDIQAHQKTKARDHLIRMVQMGYYAETISPYEVPVIELYQDLVKLGYREMLEKVIDGVYEHLE